MVQFVETVAHNRFPMYHTTEAQTSIGEYVEMSGDHPVLFAEPKGHGLSKYTGDARQLKESVNKVLIYSYGGHADDPESRSGNAISYDLIPIYTTLWQHAQDGENDTYGEKLNYKRIEILKHNLTGDDSTIEIGPLILGSAFRGNVGFKNKARPPWAWFDETDKDRPAGEWFLIRLE